MDISEEEVDGGGVVDTDDAEGLLALTLDPELELDGSAVVEITDDDGGDDEGGIEPDVDCAADVLLDAGDDVPCLLSFSRLLGVRGSRGIQFPTSLAVQRQAKK